MTRIPQSKSMIAASKKIKERMKEKRQESVRNAQLNGETWKPMYDGWTQEECTGDAILRIFGYDPNSPNETITTAAEMAFDQFAAKQLEPKHPYKHHQEMPWKEIFNRAGFNTLQAAASGLGVSVSTISNIKRGRGNPEEKTAKRIAVGLVSHAPDDKSRSYIAFYLLYPSTKMSSEQKLEVIRHRMRKTICMAAEELEGNALKALYAVSASLLQAMPKEYPEAYSEISVELPGYTADWTLNYVSDLERTVNG